MEEFEVMFLIGNDWVLIYVIFGSLYEGFGWIDDVKEVYWMGIFVEFNISGLCVNFVVFLEWESEEFVN